jgi:hypothetical protein
MGPLNLRLQPPRGPRERLAGLMMLPRTIDKARAMLAGGDSGAYFITPGLSLWLLRKLRFTEDEFVGLVRETDDEEQIARIVEARASSGRVEHLNGFMETFKVADVAEDHNFAELYGACEPDALVIDVMARDDARMFGLF